MSGIPAIAVTAAYVGAFACRENVYEIPRASNDGVFVRMAQAVTDNKAGDPWCLSECHLVGVRLLGDRWPLERTASTVELGAWALAHGIARYTSGLYDELTRCGVLRAAAHPREAYVTTAPEAGAIFLLYSRAKGRYHHAGVVTGLAGDRLATREGNTVDPSIQHPTAAQRREGVGNYPRSQPLASDLCFVEWWRLL